MKTASIVEASKNMASGYPLGLRGARVSGGGDSGRNDLLLDDVGDPKLNRPAGEAERRGQQEDDGCWSPAHNVTGERVQTILILDDERNDHLSSDSLYRQKVADSVGRMPILAYDMSELRFIHSLPRLA